MESIYASRLSTAIFTLAFVIALTGCGGGSGGSESSDQTPSISINDPTSNPSYFTTWTDARLGGTIFGASFVSVRNNLTGRTTEGYVSYNQGQGTWFADARGLGFGENMITVTADSDGTGTSIVNAYITLIRPLQPLDEIFNGPNEFSAATYWIDASSFNESHKIALFEDGTGRSTTGSELIDNAGVVIYFTWTKIAPDSILIINCPTCSFQMISRISGSISEEAFHGQIETVDGVGEMALHVFTLTTGNL